MKSTSEFSNMEWQVARNWSALDLRDAIVAVDMPIGLAVSGRRMCDEAARAALPGKASSVFPMPVRKALDFPDYAGANAWSKAHAQGGIVKQAWNLRPKILELEAARAADPDAPVYEAHPELAFARLAHGPLPKKRTPGGAAARLELLERQGLQSVRDVLKQVPKQAASADDILDAAVLLITAQRIAKGEAEHFPADPVKGANGRLMMIWR
jgi:predicted RNase H-like nuclease